MSDNNVLKHTLPKRIIRSSVLVLVTAVWIFVIFGFSSTVGDKSASQSQAITERVVRVIDHDYEMPEKVEPKSRDSFYDSITRKTAHVFAYAALGFLMLLTVRSLTGTSKGHFFAAKLAVPLCVLIAIGDEYNQTLIEGRSGRVTDVFIDTVGIIIGVCLCIVLIKHFSAKKQIHDKM